MPLFEEALDHYNLPLELKYLPVIESALNPPQKVELGQQAYGNLCFQQLNAMTWK